MKCPNCETEFTGTQCPQCGFTPEAEPEDAAVSPEKAHPAGEGPPEASPPAEERTRAEPPKETTVPAQTAEAPSPDAPEQNPVGPEDAPPSETPEPESEGETKGPQEQPPAAGKPGKGLFAGRGKNAGQRKTEKPPKEKKAKKKILVPVIAVAAVVILILIAVKAVPAILEQQHKAWLLNELTGAQETKVANLTVKLPQDWQQKEPDAKDRTVYTYEARNRKGTLIAAACLEDYARQDDNIKVADAMKKLLPAGAEPVSSTDSMKVDGCKAHYREVIDTEDGILFHKALALVEADQTWFVYALTAQEEYFTPEAVDQFLGNADFSAYKTPTVTALEVSYSGSKKRDTRIARDTEGLQVTASYSDGSKRDVTKKCEVKPAGEGAADVLMAEKTSQFDVSYGGKTAKLSVACASRWKDLEVAYTGETKAGTEITPETKGLKVTATFTDGVEDITKKCEVKPVGEGVTNVLQPDRTTEFAVTYQGKSRPLSIECSTKLEKLEAAYTGETKAGTVISKDTKGLSVKATFNDGEKDVTAECKITGPEKLEAGQTARYTIEYGGKSCPLDIQCSTLSEAQYKALCGSYTYSDLAHYPDQFEGKQIKFSGKVLQAGGSWYRIAMGGNYNTVIYVVDQRSGAEYHLENATYVNTAYMTNHMNGSAGFPAVTLRQHIPDADLPKILEDDWVTVYGECTGTETYTTVLGASVTIPSVGGYFIER